MVTSYDVMSSRWSNHFWVKIHVFSTSFKNKSKSCGYNPAKCLVMCYSSCKAKEITISRSFSLITGLPGKPSHKMGFRSSVSKSGHPGEGKHEGLVRRNDVLTNGFI